MMKVRIFPHWILESLDDGDHSRFQSMALLWRFCGHCGRLSLFCGSSAYRSSLLGRIPFEAPACSWTSPEFAPAFREPPENRYVTGARGYEDRASSCGRSPARSNDARSGAAGKPLRQMSRRGWDERS